MKKKILTAGIIAIILFFVTTICYGAQEENNPKSQNMDLGNQITESMNKVEKSAENLTNNIKNNNMVNDMRNGINDIGNGVRTDYDATKTSGQTTLNNMANMTETTWIWIVLGTVGVVILATVWFYAMQNSSND